jgi:predicted nuclease of predicted toxin-antitoxin system
VAIKFYCDEDVHLLVAAIGRQAGLDIRHTQEYGRKGTMDADQLAFAANEGRILVTVNCSDFEPITARLMQDGAPHAGVLCIPTPMSRRHPRETVSALLRFADLYPDGVPPYFMSYLH